MHFAVILTEPPGGVNLTPFDTKLTRTYYNLYGSEQIKCWFSRLIILLSCIWSNSKFEWWMYDWVFLSSKFLMFRVKLTPSNSAFDYSIIRTSLIVSTMLKFTLFWRNLPDFIWEKSRMSLTRKFNILEPHFYILIVSSNDLPILYRSFFML